MRAHKFDGRLKPKGRQTASMSQASNRLPLTTHDQHGRPYAGVSEKRSGMPSGPLFPQFKAPMHPDPKYMRINPDNTSECYIDYPNYFRERRANETEYHNRAVRLSGKKGWPAPKRGDYSEQVEEALGPLNTQTSALLVAAMYQENPWIIGACRGCSTRDKGEFIPRFSHNCVCPGGWTAFPADPRLVALVERPEDELPGSESIEDFSIDAYAKATGQTVEEATQRPAQFRRVQSLRDIVDGPVALSDDDIASVQSGEEAETSADLDAAVDELESIRDGDPMFSHESSAVDDLEEEVDPAADGGRRVAVTQQTRAPKQAPRQGNASTKRQVGAQRSAQGSKKRRRAPGDTRPSLADGAAPVIG